MKKVLMALAFLVVGWTLRSLFEVHGQEPRRAVSGVAESRSAPAINGDVNAAAQWTWQMR
jgi:hypothetical protein